MSAGLPTAQGAGHRRQEPEAFSADGGSILSLGRTGFHQPTVSRGRVSPQQMRIVQFRKFPGCGAGPQRCRHPAGDSSCPPAARKPRSWGLSAGEAVRSARGAGRSRRSRRSCRAAGAAAPRTCPWRCAQRAAPARLGFDWSQEQTV